MNSKTKIRLFYAIEILVWLIVIVLCVGAFKVSQVRKHSEYKTYRIFLQDVDGLIEGSSVRMMGVPIGYVKSINIVNDNVYVRFLITDKSVTLPQGVIATVEFNGMAGSKSLELYPPNSESKALGKMVTIKKTNRLGAALGLFDDMFAKLDSIIVRCSHFSSEVEHIFPKHESENAVSSPIQNSDYSINLVNSLITQFNNSRNKVFKTLFPENKQNIFQNMFNIDANIEETQEVNDDGQE